jgi:hypothetical protein
VKRKAIASAVLLPVIVLSTSSLLGAEEGVVAGADRDREKWQTFSAEMSPGDYRRAVRDNQRQLRKFVKSYSSETLAAVGVPRAGIAFLGAAAGLAVDGDARLPLNDSKTFALQFDNVVDSDRGLLFTFKKSW